MIAGRRKALLLAALAISLAACGSNGVRQPTDARPDAASPDVAPDGAGDAGHDAGPDVPRDAPDGGADAAPDPLPGTHWVALPAPLGAPITAITFDGAGVLYAGAGGGDPGWLPGQAGIFRSSDEGASWRAANLGLFDYQIRPVIEYQVTALAAAGATIYAGTTSLLRSTDGGASWQHVSAGPLPLSFFNHIGAGGDLVAASSDGSEFSLWVSTDAGNTFQETPFGNGWVSDLEVLETGSVLLVASRQGVVRSTDQGATFNPVQGIDNASAGDTLLRCDGARTCYASTNVGAFADIPLYKSTDAGATWTLLPGATWPSLSAAFVPEHVIAVSDTGVVYIQHGLVIERSDDGGATFKTLFSPTTTGWFEPYCNGPYAVPYAARGAKLFAACLDGVYQFDDTEQRWRSASGSPATGPITGAAPLMVVDTSPTALGPGGDIYVIALEGRNPALSDRSLLKRSSDGGWTWQIVASPFAADACTVTPGGALICRNVTISTDMPLWLARSDNHGATWREVQLPTGPGGEPVGALVTTDGSNVYITGDGGFARSSDDGRTFQVIPNSRNVRELQALRNGHLLGIELVNGGFRSTDHGTTWEPIDGLLALPVIEDAAGRLIRYAGDGKLEVSSDEASTWTSLASSGVPGRVDIPVPLAIDGADHLFAFGPGPAPGPQFNGPLQVFASADGGAHFLPMRAQIPNPNATSVATDKQGRLLVATTGGVFRLESDAEPGPPRPDGGTAGTPDGGAGGPAPRPLSPVRDDSWMPETVPIAVDTAQRVYFSDSVTIYVIDAGTTSPYLTVAEAASTAGLGNVARILDVDVGPDGQLYVLLSSAQASETTGTDMVVTSNAAHRATLLRDLGDLNHRRMKVIAAGRVGYFSGTGFGTATAAGTQSVYTGAALGWSDTCQVVRRDLAIAPSGTVAFLPGCTDGAVQRGTADGASIGVLYQPNADTIYGEHFACVATDPAGGFYALVTDVLGRHNPRLVHLPEAVTGATVPTLVPTVPTFGEVSVANGGGLFDDCTMAVAPNGVIYAQTGNQIWKVGL